MIRKGMNQTMEFFRSNYSNATKDWDAVLASDLNQLSFRERSAVYEEIHGVGEAVKEDPDLIKDSLTCLQHELNQIPFKAAFDLAMNLSNGYVESPKFRLMFLRADNFNVQKAAARMVLFMEKKKEYFGPDTLGRPIYLGDLDPEDFKTLKSGVIQFLSGRDRACRMVLGSFMKLVKSSRPYKYPENMVRAWFFIYMTAIENDEETQRKGVVSLLYFFGETPFEFDHELGTKHLPTMMGWLPVKVQSIHFCCYSNLARLLAPLTALQFSSINRVRFRVHTGSPIECHHSLLTFGIPVDCIPVTAGGKLKTAHHSKWIATQKYRHQIILKGGEAEFFALPGSNDVLLGRGKNSQTHPGNTYMRMLVKETLEAYEKAEKKEKRDMSWRIVDDMQKSGTKFIKRTKEGWWEEVSVDIAREKVNTCFQTLLYTESTTSSTRHLKKNGGSKRSRLGESAAESPSLLSRNQNDNWMMCPR